MTGIFLVIGLVLAISILAAIPKISNNSLRGAAAAGALLVLVFFFWLGSFRFVGENEIGVVVKNALGKDLPAGKIIATEGEMGPQARVLGPGWHSGLWPVIYKVEMYPVIQIMAGEVGILTASDGQPLPEGAAFAPEWNDAEAKRMSQDAEFFLREGGGYKGPQTSVLGPGKYRINPKLFVLESAKATNIRKATAGVVKSNVGTDPVLTLGDQARLVDRGEKGIWKTAFREQVLYINPKAYEITEVSLERTVIRYTKSARGNEEEREIRVRSSDGFTFPVDVRIEYLIQPEDAPLFVANLGGSDLGDVLNSAVRAIFRNNAESVKALDYVQQRSQQESQSLAMLVAEMKKIGVTVTAVRIGDVGDEETLGTLLKTQTDREIALQEQETFKEQQRAAQQRKELTRTEQEAEEEKRLATAKYDVTIAEENKLVRIIDAGAEAEAIAVRAQAQAEAYKLVAEQIGKGNAALVEMLKIVGESGISITPRVMVVGGGSEKSGDAQTTALIGTMLDSMVREEKD